ncbi:hypothetical protein VTJ04DRAFT_2377 [Mycothermus thermophilus]|uniref:uncharacterized protein n=1 Tax=Humicola insolens TaxID=85995 RepID=UPI00374411E7
MPPNDTMLTDDAVAEILAKEAREASAKYSAIGLEAFTKEPSNKARPNTRFLNQIIKRANNHNAWLREKEAAEAQARLDGLTQAAEARHRRRNPTASDIRNRQLGDISAILQGRKRDDSDRKDHDKGKHTDRPNERSSGDKNDRRSKSTAGDEKKTGSRSSTTHRKSSAQDDHKAHRSSSDRNHRNRQDRSWSPRSSDRRPRRDRSPFSSSDEDRKSSHDRSRHSRPKYKADKDATPEATDLPSQTKRHYNRPQLATDAESALDIRHSRFSRDKYGYKSSKEAGRDKYKDTTTGKETTRDVTNSASQTKRTTTNSSNGRPLQEVTKTSTSHAADDSSSTTSSDPLEDFIGPAPPPSQQPAVRYRGRGAQRAASVEPGGNFGADVDASGISTNNYNSNDDDGGGSGGGSGSSTNWDEAVEAYRDRQKWRQQGAERLRAAGFTEQQIRRWEKGGEPDIEDVRWAKAGEEREWDRGKTMMDLDGE